MEKLQFKRLQTENTKMNVFVVSAASSRSWEETQGCDPTPRCLWRLASRRQISATEPAECSVLGTFSSSHRRRKAERRRRHNSATENGRKSIQVCRCSLQLVHHVFSGVMKTFIVNKLYNTPTTRSLTHLHCVESSADNLRHVRHANRQCSLSE